MPRFDFRFAALLSYREHQRDLYRLRLAAALEVEERLLGERRDVERMRERQLEEMRSLTDAGRVNVDASAARRYHAGQLQFRAQQIDQQRATAARHTAVCREALVKADQKVKALEKIRERQWTDFQQQAERSTAREREEVWLARHVQETALSRSERRQT